jgi:endonuclease/exonuclease/phosphatase (EEP) superfamily protein YafD
MPRTIKWPFAAQNHAGPDAPLYTAQHAAVPSAAPSTLRVLSYNIFYGHETERAAQELVAFHAERPLDIVLLQEMDETGTEIIARALAMNSVYYPAAIIRRHGRNFGNAVLARWPLEAPEKVILPHRSLTTRLMRTATKASVQVGDQTIVALSAHTETVFTLPAFRHAQYTVLGTAYETATHVVIGGDFNSVTAYDIGRLQQAFAARGFARVSADGHTLAKYGIKVTADHIFARGFVAVDAGIYDAARASDHRPIWAELAF